MLAKLDWQWVNHYCTIVLFLRDFYLHFMKTILITIIYLFGIVVAHSQSPMETYTRGVLKTIQNLPNGTISYYTSPIDKGKTSEDYKQYQSRRAYVFIKKGMAFRFDIFSEDKKRLLFTVCYDGESYYAADHRIKRLSVGSALNDFHGDLVNSLAHFPLSQEAFITRSRKLRKDGSLKGFYVNADGSTRVKLLKSKRLLEMGNVAIPQSIQLLYDYKDESGEFHPSSIFSTTITITEAKKLSVTNTSDDIFRIPAANFKTIYDYDLGESIEK